MEPLEKAEIAVHESTTLELLCGKVTHNVSVVSKYLRENNLPQPSFDRHAPLTFVPAKSPVYIQNARQDLMEAALKLFQLANGPSEYIPTLALGVSLFHRIYQEFLVLMIDKYRSIIT